MDNNIVLICLNLHRWPTQLQDMLFNIIVFVNICHYNFKIILILPNYCIFCIYSLIPNGW